MADKKPDAKKAGGSSSSSDHLFELEVKIFSVVTFVVVIYFVTGKYVLESLGYSQSNPVGFFSEILNNGFDIFNSFFNILIFFSVFIILLFTLGSFYLKHKHKEVITLYKTSLPKGYVSSLSITAKNNDVKAGGSLTADKLTKEAGAENNAKITLNSSGENKKWVEVQKHISSMNPSDWRMAILEADILLYEMLDQIGYDGDTIAEKLKAIEPSDFNTLDLAWRAHKVRNAISHEGSSYEMSYQQAKNTIELYQKVFEEFYFI